MEDDETSCPLCMEDLDVTDRNFRPCPCGYQVRRTRGAARRPARRRAAARA